MLPAQSPKTDGLRILIVDRTRSAAEALADGIAQLLPARPDIVAVDCGRMAADSLRAGTFDIVTLDLASLADLGSAEDAMSKLVKLAGGALAVALSEETSVSAALAAMSTGAHDVIPKPVDGVTFIARVEALARRHGRTWSLKPAAAEVDMAAMLSGAGAALRAAAETAKPSQVLPMWQQEQRIIEDAIACFAGNITLAAQALELNPSTIYRKRQAWADTEMAAKGAA